VAQGVGLEFKPQYWKKNPQNKKHCHQINTLAAFSSSDAQMHPCLRAFAQAVTSV
jgi:hypothetical protein